MMFRKNLSVLCTAFIAVALFFVGCDNGTTDPKPEDQLDSDWGTIDWSVVSDWESTTDTTVIGTAHGDFLPPADKTSETVIGNFYADAAVEYAEQTWGEPVDFALTNGGYTGIQHAGSGEGIPAGDIALNTVNNAVKSDGLYLISVSGADIKYGFERFFRHFGTNSPTEIANVSKAVSYTISADKTSITEFTLNGVAIDLTDTTRKYRVCTISFVANVSGDRAPFYQRDIDPVDKGIAFRGAVAKYIKAHGTIDPADHALGRITGSLD
ncbi:MAG: 5'-nucleotidase C-terminal domain-containing protein [Treponema sp.]|jgi:2',3'-cyclic-nucleotide 2'-phosphodiesterase (5'-nucleotidase family)|nr:5'-nucleotidase C-terminal domain-containing protein [Treponema sp.]